VSDLLIVASDKFHTPPKTFHGTEKPMNSMRDRQLRWFNAVLDEGRFNVKEWALAAKLDPSALYKFQSGETQTLRAKNLNKLAAAASKPPPTRPGFSDGDVVAFDITDVPEISLPNTNEPALFAVKVSVDVLAAIGFERGDILIFSTEAQPQNGDIVCAQVIDTRLGVAETIIRIYDKPYLLAPAISAETRRPLIVNDDDIQLRGVLTRQIRIRDFNKVA
jgi:hypothetical protein